MLPKISLITPSYNQVDFIEKTLRSVLTQGYPNLEYIVMDGGSNDGSTEIIQRYSDQLTFWSSGLDDGQADAIKKGFDIATGDILGWINSDDFLLPGSLEHIACQFMEHPDADFLAGGYVPVDEQGWATWCIWPIEPTFERLLFEGFYLGQPACFWTRRGYVASGGLDPLFRFTMDFDLFLRILRHGKSISTTRLLACFRYHAGSKSSNLQEVHKLEKARVETQWNRPGLIRERGYRVHLDWRFRMLLRRVPQLLRLLGRYGHLRPWLYRKMQPEELL